jgi:hypothetical protein
LDFIEIAFIADGTYISVNGHITVKDVDDLSNSFSIVTSEGEHVMH